MSGEGMPKRSRADSVEGQPPQPAEVIEVTDSPPTTQPEEINSTPPHDNSHDALLERQLDELNVDEDFRESIRAMTPDTQRDILNDIIRHQQHSEVEEGLQTFGVPGIFGGAQFGFAPEGLEGVGEVRAGTPDGSDEHNWVNDEDEEEEEEEEDVINIDGGRGRGGDRAFPFGPRSFLFGQRPMAPDEDMGRARMHAFGEQEGGPMNIVDFLQFVTQHVGAQPMGPQGMRGRAAAQQQQQPRSMLEERMMGLQNLIGMLQQANTMQAMGLERDVDDMTYEELLELEERIGNVSKGVPPALLESCMTRIDATSPDETCPVCQEELQGTASLPASRSPTLCVKLLNCPHVFHKACIKQWLANNKTCPVCKQEVLPQPAASSSS